MSSSPSSIAKQLLDTKRSQVAAIFSSPTDAKDAVDVLTADTSVAREQIIVLQPGEDSLGKKIEADSQHLGKRMLASHVMMGLIGLVVGMAAAFALVTFGPALTQQNPLFTYLALISPGLFIGLFVAGLFGLRPDRTELIETVRHALKQKRTAVVVSLHASQSADSIKKVLSHRTPTIVEALR